VKCPSCGGDLPADGSARAVQCTFCRATAHLPDDVWARLHPMRPVQPFWAWLAPTAPKFEAVPSFGTLHEAVLDAAGNVYIAADEAVYSLDADLAPRWARRDIHVDERAIALFPDGRLWVRGRTSAVLLSAADGSTLGPGPDLPRSSTASVFDVYVAHGASLLVSTMHEDMPCFRVRRLTLDGQPLRLFEPKKQGFLGKMFASADDGVTLARNAGAKVLPALGAYMFLIDSPNFDVQLALCAPDGTEPWRQALPLEFPHSTGYRVLPERDGSAIVWAPNYATLLRVGPRGVAPVLPPHRAAIVLSRESLVLPMASGELLVLGSEGDIVRLTPDGREVWSNEPAKARVRRLEVAAQQN